MVVVRRFQNPASAGPNMNGRRNGHLAGMERARRQRTASSKVRTFDAATRNEIKRKRLESLEADNWQEDKRRDDDEDDDYNPLDDASSGDGALHLCAPPR